ncbi:NYN domain-containing protein [Patescibacteria group bacterium]|nr:NYN domain-containing protein [Patescibacteria group bacterium]
MKAKKNLQTKSNLTKIKVINFPVFASGQRRVFSVYIDGGNFFHSLKNCGIQEKDFDYRGFVNWLCGENVENVIYYVGQVKRENNNPKSEELYKSQQQRFERLKKAGFYIVRGRLVRIGGKFMEKGVDVRIGVDIAIGAAQDFYEKAFVVSSDSDLIPAIEFATIHGEKEIIYVGFEESFVSYHLIQKSSSSKIVKKFELEKFILKSKK